MHRRAAQALVETALVFPMLVSLSLGGLQVLLYAHAHTVVLSAVQEGARLAAEDGRTADDGYQRAGTLIAAGVGSALDPVRLVVTSDDDTVVVRADAGLRPLIALPVLDVLPVHAEARLMREHFRPAGGAP